MAFFFFFGIKEKKEIRDRKISKSKGLRVSREMKEIKKLKLITHETRDQVCSDKWNGSWKSDLLYVQLL